MNEVNKNVELRDLKDLLKTPHRPLTKDEIEHFDEYMTFKNNDVSANEVDISDSVNDIINNFEHYMGFTENKE
ncbi:MAG: hypothetical protein LBB56_03510 [Chitinispirillales bacterium]|jgi:hypothetical protein|nr:hypothetical protein [Chitinispirillales bacterium]